MATEPVLEITQVRSLVGARQAQRRTVRSLGLRRIRHTVSQPDRPEIRGMLAKVAHLVEVRYAGDELVELEAGQEPKGAGRPAAAHSVADEEVAELVEAREEALAEPGSVADIGDLVDNPPTLRTTDTVNKPKQRRSPLEEEEEEEAAVPLAAEGGEGGGEAAEGEEPSDSEEA